ncbi:hydrogenase 4 subunit B [Candidatus Methylospira mobilis]|uniref:Hydrogenase 4 subunit B n=1 Tax=Candidatus Methylospira mobilis TaxID=1808979 RepID=A0A5Q0BSY6_9GAMM|nr:hydrogenase 4 subunit B [Candidatus Methylospira mobilis]QFY44786.1 hydrogenase 4 subunit B [Candidatus Methylospira mobilis]WNV05673.1 hydrogenase 4 subunit B [Candidatus Methylospira mobilis]
MLLSIVYFSVAAALGSAMFAAVAAQSTRAEGRTATATPSLYSAFYRNSLFILLGFSGIGAVWAGISILLDGKVLNDVLPLGLPWLHWHIRLDPLSGFFLCVLGLPLLAVSLYGPGYIREFERGKHGLSVLGVFTGLFVAGMELVLLADDAFLFMIAWEMMSVASYFLVAYQHEHSENRRAAFLYLLMAEIGAITIILAFGVLAGFGSGLTFEALRSAVVSPAWASIAFVLGLIGFGMKAGLVPVHAWLPEAHPVAPSHISALMSGVMLKIAVYGFIRFTFDLLGGIQWQWGVLVLIVGSASALLGILYALQKQNLKRILAYSSVENMGIVFIALGLSLIFLSSGKTLLATLGLVAALLHCLNHALFKTLLFLGSGIILHQTHEHSLEKMGGLIHRMPKLSVIFLIGTLSISALPPLNGFVSEWLIFKTALRASELESGILRSLIPTTSAVLALTSALAATCFVKIYGVAFLGRARSHHVAKADEIGDWRMLAGPGLLAVCCVLIGLLPAPLINTLASLTQQITGATLPSVSDSGWFWLTPISSTYSPSLLLLCALMVGGSSYFLLSRRTGLDPRMAEPWDCGFGGLDASMQYTSGAFSMPIRRIFNPVFKVLESLDIQQQGPAQSQVTRLGYRFQIIDRAWLTLYEPIGWAVTRLAQWLGRLQTGNIRTYLGYSFFTLLLLLWVIS